MPIEEAFVFLLIKICRPESGCLATRLSYLPLDSVTYPCLTRSPTPYTHPPGACTYIMYIWSLLHRSIYTCPTVRQNRTFGHELHFISQFKYRRVLLFKEGIVEKSSIYVPHDSIKQTQLSRRQITIGYELKPPGHSLAGHHT